MAATCLIGPSLAEGSTALVQPAAMGLAGTGELAYTAGPGEQNRTLIRSPSMTDVVWVVSDPGALITPGAGCESLDPHTVRCATVTSGSSPLIAAPSARVRLADLDDEVRIHSEAAFAGRHLVADGGAGNDLLVGGSGGDRLDGGPGSDVLRGGAGGDQLLDPGAPEGDVMDGGAGDDSVSYQGRTAAVTVDLAAGRGGERGERDSLRSIESVLGGRGDDMLSGNSRDNSLDGRGGRDRLSGLAGNDSFWNGSGPIECGAGSADTVYDPTGSDFLEPDCEWIQFDEGVELPAAGSVRGERFSYRPRCPGGEDGVPLETCSGTLVLRETKGRHRLLARKSFPERRWRDRRIVAPLTAAGRRLSSRRGGVRATVTVLGREWRGVRWSLRLVSRRGSRASARSARGAAA